MTSQEVLQARGPPGAVGGGSEQGPRPARRNCIALLLKPAKAHGARLWWVQSPVGKSRGRARARPTQLGGHNARLLCSAAEPLMPSSRSVSPSDAELVERSIEGSSEAFDLLMDRYWNAARSIAYQRTRSWADAEDAAQDAFVLAFNKLASLRNPERFGGWLFVIVHRSCIEGARRRARRPTPVPDVEAVKVMSNDAEDLPSDSGLRAEIMSAIEALPDRYRPVVIMRYGQGLAVKDIGRALGLPPGTVVSQMFRANRILRTRLKHLVGS